MNVTEESIAREAGVSKASVSRFFDPRQSLKPETRARIEPLIEKYEFRPKKRTVFKKRAKTGVCGLLAPFSSDICESAYHRAIFGGIIEGLKASEYDLRLIMMRDEDYHNLRRFLEKYLIDGLLILTWRSHPNLIKLVESGSKPFPVMLLNDFERNVNAHFVYCDVTEGPRKAIDHLVRSGRMKIAFLKGPTHNRIGSDENAMHIESIDSRDKYEGFRQAMTSYRLGLNEEWIRECECYTKKEGYLKAAELFGRGERPDGVICSNDALAAGVLAYLKEHGIRCPEDVSVIGFDGYDEGESADPPLTTIKQPLREMGRKASEQLIDIITGRFFSSGSFRFKFEPELVVRKSA